MATDAGNAVGQVHGTIVVAGLFGVLMAAKTGPAGLRGSGVFKSENLGSTASVNPCFARAMASLAAVPFDTLVCVELGIQGGDPVSSSCETLVNLLVAGLAGVGAGVKREVRGSEVVDGLLRRLLVLVGSFVACMEQTNRPRSCTRQCNSRERTWYALQHHIQPIN